MCGICGQYNFRDHTPVDPDVIKRMTRTMVHRGPDDEGYYLSGPLGFGFRRLSIIDLKGGHQPMSDQEESIWIIFNGEIYNFLELRKELEGYGHTFRTKCDTEVIIQGYKQWGVDVFNHLNGMFGLAIWDIKKQKLIIVRDRMGIKFVYYKIDSGKLYFGSEIRAILEAQNNTPDFNLQAISLFLRYRFTPSPLTVIQGINKLAPGTMLVIKEGGAIYVKRWWKFRPVPFSPVPSSKQAEEELFELYRKAVKRHLISDVPLGILLSGGVDSALLLALMGEHGNSWKTFTVGYGKNFKDDEINDAARTAKILGFENEHIEIDREYFEESLSKIISVIEEPIAPSSIVPMYCVCELARRSVKTAFIGQGPDELFGGYTRHLGVRYGDYWRAIPRQLRELSKPLLAALPRLETLKRGLYSLDVEDRMKRYQNVFSLMPGEDVEGLFKDGFLSQGDSDEILECWEDLAPLMENTDDLGGLSFLEISSTLPDELLLYADKLSMAHGLELRVPYLDQEIVEFVERLPASFKVHRWSRKWLHKKVSQKLLPMEIIQRKKRGFAVNVVDDWFRGSVSGNMDKIFVDENSLIYEFLKPKSVSKLLSEHRRGVRDNYKVLFSIVILEGVLRNYGTSP